MGPFGKRREQSLTEETGELTSTPGTETSPEIGFEAVAAEIRSVRKPRVSRVERDKKKSEEERQEQIEITKREFLSGGIPHIVAKIYERGIDIASLALLAGMQIPSAYYKPIEKGEDAELWAKSCMEYTFQFAPEKARQIWLFVSMIGLPILHVGEGVMVTRERYLESVGVSGNAGSR